MSEPKSTRTSSRSIVSISGSAAHAAFWKRISSATNTLWPPRLMLRLPPIVNRRSVIWLTQLSMRGLKIPRSVVHSHAEVVISIRNRLTTVQAVIFNPRSNRELRDNALIGWRRRSCWAVLGAFIRNEVKSGSLLRCHRRVLLHYAG